MIFWESFRLFESKKGVTLAAASTFYLILTIIPLILVVIRGVGLILGEMETIQGHFFEMLSDFFPMATAGLIEKVEHLITAPLSKGKNTLINLVLLSITSVSFFNSIWNGLYLMTDDRSHLSIFKHLKGMAILFGTIFLMFLILFIPITLKFIFNFLQDGKVVDFILDYFPSLQGLLSFVLEFNYDSLLFSPFAKFLIFTLYFTYLYKWFFGWKISTKSALVGSVSFILTLTISKNLFWVYFKYMRDGLISNYGDYYTLIVGIIWFFVMLCLFFYGASICHVIGKRRNGELPPISLELFKKA